MSPTILRRRLLVFLFASVALPLVLACGGTEGTKSALSLKPTSRD
jgi:hypothetical protein